MSNDRTKEGSLLLNGTEQIRDFNDNEFGVDYRVKPRTQCYLYSRLPDTVNVTDPSGMIQSINGKNPYPATFTDSYQNSVGIINEVNPQQLMLARAIPMYPEFMEVILYESAAKADPNMPETGNEITILHKGYVTTESIRPLQTEKAGFIPMTDPLFPNPSLLEDVKQFKFGDCFLLASILAILAKPNGANMIRSMMIQDGDSTIVKLFHPVTKEPHFIRVKNTSFHAQNTNYNRHQAPWVHILEKAYTAFAFINETSQSFPSFKEMFGNGGFSKTALTILTGNLSSEHNIPNVWENTSPIHYFANKSSIDHDATPFLVGTKWEHLQAQHNDHFPIDLQEVQAHLHDNTHLDNIINQALDEYDAATFNLIVSSYRDFIESDHPLRSIIRNLQDFIELNSLIYKHIANAAKPAGLLDKANPIENMNDVYLFIDELSVKKLLPAKFTQRLFEYAQLNSEKWTNPNREDYYTPELNKLYDNIKSAISIKNNVVTASSKTKFDETVPGLRNRHAYAVIGTEEVETNGIMHKYVVMRNPWGRIGRGYAQELDYRGLSANSTEIENGTFKLELTDFQRYFRSYTTGTISSVSKTDLLISNHKIGTEQLYLKVVKIRTACDQFKKDLRSKLSLPDTDKATLEKQIKIIEDAESKLIPLNSCSTKSSLNKGIQHFQSVIYDKNNLSTIQKSNDSAGKIFLQVIATILSLGIMYDRFFNRTHQKTFVRELDRVNTPEGFAYR